MQTSPTDIELHLLWRIFRKSRAISNGADVFGYLHWSFMDNYEWLDTYRPEGKFGLFSIDRNIGSRNERLGLSRQKTKEADALR